MKRNEILDHYRSEVEGIREAGLLKGELPIVSAQSAHVKLEDGRELLCMCANNYLGLGDSPRLIEAAKRTYDNRGYGVASVRFICGRQTIRSCIPPALMRTAVCLRHCSRTRTQSSATASITLRSSTASVCARRRDTAMRTTIWLTWKRSCRKQTLPAHASS